MEENVKHTDIDQRIEKSRNYMRKHEMKKKHDRTRGNEIK